MNTFKEALATIHAATLTSDEIDELREMYTYKRSQLGKQNIRSFRVGQQVQFDGGPRRGMFTGTIEKINIKKVKVRTPQGIWNVPADMLEAV